MGFHDQSDINSPEEAIGAIVEHLDEKRCWQAHLRMLVYQARRLGLKDSKIAELLNVSVEHLVKKYGDNLKEARDD